MEKDARGVKCNKDNRTLMWKGVRRLCRQFKTTRRLWAHTNKAKLCSSFLLLRLEINFFFSYTGEKEEKKQAMSGWLVLAKTNWFACIGQEGRVYPWAGRMESHTDHPSDWQSKDSSLYFALASASIHLPQEKIYLLRYWAGDNVVNGLRHK